MIEGNIIVENPNSKLANFSFCKRGESSDLATKRYQDTEQLKQLINMRQYLKRKEKNTKRIHSANFRTGSVLSIIILFDF